jgi:hypothetical protein
MKKQKGIHHQHNRAQKEAKRIAVVAAKKRNRLRRLFPLFIKHEPPLWRSGLATAWWPKVSSTSASVT